MNIGRCYDQVAKDQTTGLAADGSTAGAAAGGRPDVIITNNGSERHDRNRAISLSTPLRPDWTSQRETEFTFFGAYQ